MSMVYRSLFMTLKMPAIGISNKLDDTLETLEHNTENIDSGVVKFVSYLKEDILKDWIKNDAKKIIDSYFKVKQI